MKEAAARVLCGLSGLGESESHDAMPVDRLHALAAAQRGSRLSSLGVDLIRLKLSNVPQAYEPCKVAICIFLMERSDQLKIRPKQASLIAAQALQEHIIDFCGTCHGRGEIVDYRVADDREGAVPMKSCPTCGGHKMRRYTDSERAEAIGSNRKLDRAYDAAHSIISTALHEALWNARRFFRA